MESAPAEWTIVVVRDVLLELGAQNDDVFAWTKPHATFVPLEDRCCGSATEILEVPAVGEHA